MPQNETATPVTTDLPAADLGGRILVGESGGLSQVYEVTQSSAMPGMMAVETEHGFLYLDADPDQTFTVLDS